MRQMGVAQRNQISYDLENSGLFKSNCFENYAIQASMETHTSEI